MAFRWLHWLEYIILLLLLLFLGLFFQTYELFCLLVVWLAFPLISWLIARYVKKNTKFTLHAQRAALEVMQENELSVLAEPLKKAFFSMGRVLLTLELQNDFFEPEAFAAAKDSCNEKRTMECELAIRPGGSRITLLLRAQYCGNVRVRITQAEFLSMLGLFRFTKSFSAETEYAVYPVRLSGGSNERTSGGIGNEELAEDDRRGENSSQIRQINPYKPGDRMQKIHWKASAKKEEWMVKEYAGTLSDEITIVCELSGERRELHDIITLAYTAAAYWVEETGKISFRWWNHAAAEWRIAVVISVEELQEALRELFYAKCYPDAHEGYRHLQQEFGGKIFYVNSRKQLAGISGKRIEQFQYDGLSAGMIRLEVDG